MQLTIEMLDQMNEQDVFDVAAGHLLNQGTPACDCLGHCLYRAPGNRRCAVGWLIPDSVYSPAFEYRGVIDLASVAARTNADPRFRAFLSRHFGLLCGLQEIHDRRHPCDWPACLAALASQWGLRSTVVREHAARTPEPQRQPQHVGARLGDTSWLQIIVPLVDSLAAMTFTEVYRVSEKREEAREAAYA
jgi:hypothetical protein